MNSNEVNIRIRAIIWPALKAEGFDTFDSRTAWRHQNGRIDVVNFQSKGLTGVPPSSFSVNLGCCMESIPFRSEVKVKNGNPLPKEFQCCFRGGLKRSFFQFQCLNKDIWHIDKEGKSLEKSLQDVLMQIRNKAFPWFVKLDDKAEVLRILCNEDEQMGKLWGFGRNPSPHRSYLVGYHALSLGDHELATRKLQEAVDSGCFKDLFIDVNGAIMRSNNFKNRRNDTA